MKVWLKKQTAVDSSRDRSRFKSTRVNIRYSCTYLQEKNRPREFVSCLERLWWEKMSRDFWKFYLRYWWLTRPITLSLPFSFLITITRNRIVYCDFLVNVPYRITYDYRWTLRTKKPIIYYWTQKYYVLKCTVENIYILHVIICTDNDLYFLYYYNKDWRSLHYGDSTTGVVYVLILKWIFLFCSVLLVNHPPH